MDLNSAAEGASWHPLSFLIDLHGSWEARSFLSVPFIAELNQWSISTLHHELTHLGAARGTRLGAILAKEGTIALRAWRNGDKISVHPGVETVLGAMTPLLEGLALYAELDYEFDGRPEDWPPFPLGVRAAMTWMRAPMPPLATFRNAREMAIAETPFGQRGHLKLLFAPRGEIIPLHYFSGYLYVKAAIALIGRRCPSLATPAVALPLLNRLWADHPAIDDLAAGRMDIAGFIAALHGAASGTTAEAWQGIRSMLEADPSLGGGFDRWRLYEQIASGRFDTPLLRAPKPPVVTGVSDAFRTVLAQVTASSEVHVLACTMGRLHPPDNNGDFCIGEERSPIKLLPLKAFWRATADFAPERKLIERHRDKALAMERKLRDKLRAAVGKHVTLADIVTLTGEYSCCVALWIEGEKGSAFVPYTMSVLDRHATSEFRLLRDGTAISLKERLEFSRSLTMSPTQLAARSVASDLLLEHLVSNPRGRELLRQHRLGGAAALTERREIMHWLRPNPGRQGNWILEVAPDGKLARTFDFPGFVVGNGETEIRFADLLPPLPAVSRVPN
jgi:hypothetical protein